MLTARASPAFSFEDAAGTVIGLAQSMVHASFWLALEGEPLELRRTDEWSQYWYLALPDGTLVGSLVFKWKFETTTVEVLLPDEFDDGKKCFFFWLCAKWEMEHTQQSG